MRSGPQEERALTTHPEQARIVHALGGGFTNPERELSACSLDGRGTLLHTMEVIIAPGFAGGR